jgi:hypothetical protein
MAAVDFFEACAVSAPEPVHGWRFSFSGRSPPSFFAGHRQRLRIETKQRRFCGEQSLLAIWFSA